MKMAKTALVASSLLCLLSQAALGQATPPDQGGNSVANATALGTNPAGVTLNDMVGVSDTYDYFSFSLNETRSTTVELSGLTGNADVYLWGDNGTWVMSNSAGTADENINRQLRPGNYTMLIYAWAGTVNYRLSVNSVGQPVGRTEQLGLIDGMRGSTNTNRALQGNIGANERWVDYVFELPDTRDVRISVQSTTGAAVSPLTTPQRWLVADQQGLIATRMSGGEHFVRIFGSPGQVVPFSLSISAATPDTGDNAGNTFASANNLGTVGNPPAPRSDYVGRWDFDDFYVFNAPPGSVVNADLVHTSGSGADIYLYDVNGSYVTHSANPGTAYDTLSVNSPQGGTYYLRVATATRSGPNWENAQYTVRAGTVPLRSSPTRPTQPAGSPSCPLGPDRNNCITAPAFFDGGVLNEGGMRSVQQSVGGLNDPVDHFTLRVGCQSPKHRPTFDVTFTGAVTVDLDRIRPDNGNRVDQPFTQGGNISPLAAEDKLGTFSYEYRFAVTPNGIGIGGTGYTITATHNGCS